MAQALEEIEQEAFSEIEREHYTKIKTLERKCASLETDYESDKATAAASKKRWEKAISDLRTCIQRGPDDQKQLPFKEDWRTKPIVEAIDLTAKQEEKLEELKIVTVEQFENLRAGKVTGFPNGLIDVDGWGRQTVDKLEDAIVDWMTHNARDEEPSAEEQVVARVEDPFEEEDGDDDFEDEA